MEWKKRCKSEAELISKQMCKYTHRAERLIHVELAKYNMDLSLCTGCKEFHMSKDDIRINR